MESNACKKQQPIGLLSQQPHDRAVRLPEVIIITQRSKTMLYGDMRAGIFPAGFLTGKRSRAWMLSDVMAWLESRKAAAGVV